MSATRTARQAAERESLAARVDSLFERAVELAEGYGVSAPRRARSTGSRPTAVLVGEPGRGKTALINALLGRPGLLPEGETGLQSFVVLRHGPPGAVFHLRDRAAATRLDLADLAAGTERHAADDVSWVDVQLESTLLEDLDLIDTPAGAIGDADGASATLQALGEADFLVFVLDGRAPLTAPELRYLERLSAGSVASVLVLARRDLYPAWQRIIDDNRALLARHAPRFSQVPLLAVSARLAQQAAQARERGRDEAVQLEQRSGMPALRDALTALARAELGWLRLAMDVRAADAVLARLVELAKGRLIDPSDEAHELALRQARERLEDHQRDTGDHATRVGDEFTRLEVRLRRSLTRQLQDLGRDWTRRVGGSSAKQLNEFPAALERDITLVLARLQEEFRTEVSASIARLESSLDLVGLGRAAETGFDQPIQPALSAADRRRDEPTELRRADNVLQAAGLVVGAGGPMVVANLLANALGLGIGAILAPYALAAGVALGGLRLYHQRRSKDLTIARQQAAEVLRDAFESVRSEVPATLTLKLVDIRRSVEADVRSLIRERAEVLRRERDELQRRLAADAAERSQQLEQTRQQLRSLEGGRRTAADLLSELDALAQAGSA